MSENYVEKEITSMIQKKKKKSKSPMKRDTEIHSLVSSNIVRETRSNNMETNVVSESVDRDIIEKTSRKKRTKKHSKSFETEDQYVVSDEDKLSSLENFVGKVKERTRLQCQRSRVSKIHDLDSSKVSIEADPSDIETNSFSNISVSVDRSNVKKSSGKILAEREGTHVASDEGKSNLLENFVNKRKKKKKKSKSPMQRDTEIHSLVSSNIIRETSSNNMETNVVSEPVDRVIIEKTLRKKRKKKHSKSFEAEDQYVVSDEDKLSSLENFVGKEKKRTRLQSQRNRVSNIHDLDASNVSIAANPRDIETNSFSNISVSVDRNNVKKSSGKMLVEREGTHVASDESKSNLLENFVNKRKKKKKSKSPMQRDTEIHSLVSSNIIRETRSNNMETNVVSESVGRDIIEKTSRKKRTKKHSKSFETEGQYVVSDEDKLSSLEDFVGKEKKRTRLQCQRNRVSNIHDIDSANVSIEANPRDIETNSFSNISVSVDRSNVKKSSGKMLAEREGTHVASDEGKSDLLENLVNKREKKKKIKSKKTTVSNNPGLDSSDVSVKMGSSDVETNAISDNFNMVNENVAKNSVVDNRSEINFGLAVRDMCGADSNVCSDVNQSFGSMSVQDEVWSPMFDSEDDDGCNLRLVLSNSESDGTVSPVCETPSTRSSKLRKSLRSEFSYRESDNSFESDEDLEDYLDNISNTTTVSEDLTKKLNSLLIFVDDPHPLHCVNTPTHKAPAKEIKEDILAKFVVKEGSFRKQEDDIIMANWEKFSQMHKVESPEPFLHPLRFKLKSPIARDFLKFLGQGLPERTLYKIHNRFKYLCEHKKKGLFSPKEDKLILKVMQKPVKQPFCVLSKILKRNRQCVYKRYRMLLETKKDKSSEPKMKRAVWSIDLATSVVKALTKVLEIADIEELRNRKIETVIWRKVEALTKVSYWKLKQYWCYQLHVQLFAIFPISANYIFKKIVNWLHEEKPKTMQDISWKNLTHLFPGSTEWFMWERFRRLRKRNEARKFKNLEAFTEFLFKHPKSVQLPSDILTPRYHVKNDFTLTVIKD